MQFVFIVCPSRALPKYIATMVLITFLYLIKTFFKKSKKSLELVSLPHFLHDVSKNIYHVIFYELAKFHYLIDFIS